MTIEEIKSAVEQKTGIPAALLYGTTEEEIFNYARQLAAFKSGNAPRATGAGSDPGAGSTKTTREQWADYLCDIGIGEAKAPERLIDRVETAINEIHPGYPALNDGGEISPMSSATPTRDKFAEFMSGVFSFNPFYD